MKKFAIILLLIVVASFSSAEILENCDKKSPEHAVWRAMKFADTINYNYETPEKIYPFLSASYREQLDQEGFIQAFSKERSYPYLTPLFLNIEEVSISGEKGIALYSQAARLPGMFVEIPLVFENGDYYFDYFTEFLDGSYLKKFERLEQGGK